jgi:predicted membrane-bound spermidine synthase
MQKRTYYSILFIFTLSGFSGLIYESIWSHYLKLFLGHAAYAQTLVLAIYMGGMALGSWISSRYSPRWKNLLIGYAAAEGLIGLFAMAFHTVFDHAIQFSYAAVIPALGSAAFAILYKWALSALLILPQSILLGMTFPLMTAGVIRLAPQNPGRTISLLYFTNSLGAAIGVLVSGFILIRLIGLPWTIRLAGLINMVLALAVWRIVKGQRAAFLNRNAEADKPRAPAVGGRHLLFLFASFLTGAASFIYEIGWIRMLSLVLGSSTHAFELMLSAFILGLALGGLWIQRRIDRLFIPERYLAYVQVIMGLCALATLPLYGQAFDVMQRLVNALSKTDTGYLLFNLSSNAIALAIMLPATFFAGMTLPLITFVLMKRGHGERSIGEVYAANTVGAILGVFFAIHIGMPLFGLKGLITFGAGCDIALGAMLFWTAAEFGSKRTPALISALGICAISAVLLFVSLDPYKMASGVYRVGKLLIPQETELLYYRDGKTATITSRRDRYADTLTIATNGKPDAQMRLPLSSQAAQDEPTMILLGILPMAFHPQAETAANIGLGSGLTTQMLLSNPRLKQVDTVEIEESVVEAARNFRPRVDLVYTDPRSRIHLDDAKTFFSVHHKKYDIIISEPSNPWVSGVSGLFSEEFYRLLNRHLTPNGVFVQWVQLYEIDVDLVISILKAVSGSFSDFVVYTTNDYDMLIIAKAQGSLSSPDPRVFGIPRLSEELARVHIRGIQDIEIRKVGNKRFLNNLIKTFAIRANSDYYPVVDQNAARARFLQAFADVFRGLAHDWLPALELLTKTTSSWGTTDVTLSPFAADSEPANTAMALRDYVLYGNFDRRHGNIPSGVQELAVQLKQMFFDCGMKQSGITRRVSLMNAVIAMVPYLSPRELEAISKKLESGPCAGSLSSDERNWLGLFKALSKRDPGAMVSASTAILESEKRLLPNAVKILVASGMLGHLMQDDREASLKLWSAYRSSLFKDTQPDLLFRLLAAESSAPD